MTRFVERTLARCNHPHTPHQSGYRIRCLETDADHLVEMDRPWGERVCEIFVTKTHPSLHALLYDPDSDVEGVGEMIGVCWGWSALGCVGTCDATILHWVEELHQTGRTV